MIQVEDLIEEYAVKIAAQEKERFLERSDALTMSQSPIENLMAAALLFAVSSDEWFNEPYYKNKFEERGEHDFTQLEKTLRSMGIYIWPEATVGKYRADFLVCFAHFNGGYSWGAIECDGHNHHNLTKEQAEHDRERDRYFQSIGLLILRFTGTEISRAPLKAATGALSIMEKRAAS